MPAIRTAVSRRAVVGAGLGAAALAVTPPVLAALVATPPQTTGPFYPRVKPLDDDADLTRVEGNSGRAAGTPIQVLGRVLDRAGRPRRGVRVEIWQCNAFGRYHHPRDNRDAPIDPNFQGFGHDITDAAGAYRFKTIQPPPYPASALWMRPAHIHFAVAGPGFEPLITQMYFAGDPYLADDSIFNRIADPAARASVVATLAPPAADIAADGPVAAFDIVLG